MQIPNVLETPENPNLPKSDNDSVGSISRHVEEMNWLAGIIDGEGCIHLNWGKAENKSGKIGRKYAICRCEIRNSNPFMIQKISQIYHRLNLTFNFFWVKAKNGHKDQMVIIVQTLGSVQKLLMSVCPFLTAKKEEANTMLRYIEWRQSGFLSMRKLTDEEHELLLQKQQEMHDALCRVKKIHYGFQRLPREASRPLDLSNLETVV